MTTLTPTELAILRRIAAASRGYRNGNGYQDTACLRSLRLRGYIEKLPRRRVSDKQLWRLTEKGRTVL